MQSTLNVTPYLYFFTLHAKVQKLNVVLQVDFRPSENLSSALVASSEIFADHNSSLVIKFFSHIG